MQEFMLDGLDVLKSIFILNKPENLHLTVALRMIHNKQVYGTICGKNELYLGSFTIIHNIVLTYHNNYFLCIINNMISV